jgi:hypothetical protein
VLSQLADMVRWIAAVAVGVAPRRVWPALERQLPLRSAAAASGLVTLLTGFFIGVGGFFTFATRLASANNTWMLAQLAAPSTGRDADIALVPYGMSMLTLFIFLFFTPTGLFALYLSTSGTLRAISAWLDDPRGDFVLSGLHWAATTMFEKNRQERQQIARERLEGDDARDVLQTGAWAGLPDADYVVLAARRKSEWTAGAIVMTSSDWYKLGVPFDIQTPAGLRTAYPLKKMETVEVVRRGIQYELPRLRGTQRPQSAQS